VLADPGDDLVLECAVTAAADMIVTGDEHLLAMKKFRGISILSPAAFMEKAK
jgi:predicted nucleic acid-binding protein